MEEKLRYGYGLMPDLSTHGHTIDRLIYVIHIFMLLLFVGWGIFLLVSLIRFRSRPGHKANYQSVTSKFPKYAEIVIVLFEVVLLVGLSFPVWNKYRNSPPPEDQAFVVRVIGEQFQWNVHYPGEDKKFGRTDPKFFNSSSNPLAIDPDDPASADDVVNPELHFPVNQPVIVQVGSKDVIHSFAIPVLRVKQDANPGMAVPVWFTAKKTGVFEIVCSQLCGLGHTRMGGRAYSQKIEDFEKWWQEQVRPFKPKEPKAADKDLPGGTSESHAVQAINHPSN